ncbi:hypothetical protein BV97_03527 [Novosphingobium resinovorum]|uniref:MASP n=1 Tax=Novosphingobium resinovorum TaxID=158500 RepID=A0A031JU10_9SPHN|nr:hypothetical protein [Novosphingobium resinovorum]EZP80440.1 hypothetical protein BV97_03527 [Novosphingobium resinovorum]
MRAMRKLAPKIAAAAAVAFMLPSAVMAGDTGKPAASAPEPGNPEARRQMLNAREAAAAQEQLARNEASRSQYDAALALNDMKTARDAAASTRRSTGTMRRNRTTAPTASSGKSGTRRAGTAMP